MSCFRFISATSRSASQAHNTPRILFSVNIGFLISHFNRNISLYFQFVHHLIELTDKLIPLAAIIKKDFYNGKEFDGHILTDEKLLSKGCFSRSFALWERGSNEDLIGLLGQYIPKKFPRQRSLMRKLEFFKKN